MKTVAALAVVFVLFLALIVSLGMMGERGWPPLFWDANMQITPAINRASGRGDTYASYGTRILWQGVTDYRFNWHGQLYQALLGALLSGSDFLQLMRCVGWINIASTVACAVYFYCHLRMVRQQSVLTASLWALVGAAATAAVLLHWQGRPEQLVPVILCLSGLVQLQVPAATEWLIVARGATAGVVAATSPLPGVLLVSANVLRLAANPGDKRWLQRSMVLGLAAAAVWAVLIWAICPYSPWTILSNSVTEAAGGKPRSLSRIPAYWFWTVDYPLIGGIYLLFVAAFIPRLLDVCRLGLLRSAAVAALFANLFRWTWIGGLASPPYYYSLICFFPVIYLYVIDQAHEWPARWGRAVGPAALAVVAGLGVSVSLGYVRHLGLLQCYLADGLTLPAARALAREYIARLDFESRIAYDGGRMPALVVLSDASWSLYAVDFSLDEVNRLETRLGIRLRYFFYSQNQDTTPPPRVGPFVLSKNHYIPGRPRLLGLELAPAMPGYQFAVYERFTEARPSE